MFSGRGSNDVVCRLAIGAGDFYGLGVDRFKGSFAAEVRDGDRKSAIRASEKKGMHELGDRHGRLPVTTSANFEQESLTPSLGPAQRPSQNLPSPNSSEKQERGPTKRRKAIGGEGRWSRAGSYGSRTMRMRMKSRVTA